MPHMAGSVQNQKGLLRKHNTSTNISLSHRDQNIPRLGTRAAPPEFTDVGGPLPHTTPLNMATVKAYILKNIHRRVAPTYHNNLKRSKLQRDRLTLANGKSGKPQMNHAIHVHTPSNVMRMTHCIVHMCTQTHQTITKHSLIIRGTVFTTEPSHSF